MRADIVAILSRLFPHEVVAVTKMLRTNWATDEYSMGAFSFPAVGYVPLREMDALQRPIGRVHWAGEHSSRYLYQKMGTAQQHLRPPFRFISAMITFTFNQ